MATEHEAYLKSSFDAPSFVSSNASHFRFLSSTSHTDLDLELKDSLTKLSDAISNTDRPQDSNSFIFVSGNTDTTVTPVLIPGEEHGDKLGYVL